MITGYTPFTNHASWDARAIDGDHLIGNKWCEIYPQNDGSAIFRVVTTGRYKDPSQEFIKSDINTIKDVFMYAAEVLDVPIDKMQLEDMEPVEESYPWFWKDIFNPDYAQITQCFGHRFLTLAQLQATLCIT